MWHDGWWFFGMHYFWWLFWIVVIFLLFWMFRSIPAREVQHRETPLEILQRRYASGEVTTQDYNERKEQLKKDGSR
jgi:putative membrane protein